MVASFLTLTIPYLQQDYTAVTASLLTELVVIQRTTSIGGNVSAIPQSALTFNTPFSSSLRDIWLNNLWIASLITTLFTALMSGLIKQWLQYYAKDISGANPKSRALTRQFRYSGLILWGVPQITEALPIMMNISLFLFFAGLVLLVQDLSNMGAVMWFLVGITGATFSIYTVSSFIPIWNSQCPYKTSLSKLFNGMVRATWAIFFAGPVSIFSTTRIMQIKIRALLERCWESMATESSDVEDDPGDGDLTPIHDAGSGADLEASSTKRQTKWFVAFAYLSRGCKNTSRRFTQLVIKIIPGPPSFMRNLLSPSIVQIRISPPSKRFHKMIKMWINRGYGSSMSALEAHVVNACQADLLMDVIKEMALKSTNPSVSSIAFQSMSALDCVLGNDIHDLSRGGNFNPLIDALRDRYSECLQREPGGGSHITVSPQVAERYSRALLAFPSHMTDYDDLMHRSALEEYPLNLQNAALAVLTITSRNSLWQKHGVQRFINCVMESDCIDSTQLHSWHYAKFTAVFEYVGTGRIEKALPHHFTDEWMMGTLIKKLGFFKNEMNLQTELLIGFLFGRTSKSVHCDLNFGVHPANNKHEKVVV